MYHLLYQYILTVSSLILFLHEFFPVQNNRAKESLKPPTHLNDIKLNVSETYRPEFDRIILIIVDALRLDFVTQENLPFAVSAFHKQGCMLKVHVQSPTVTLPRIKAITTGRVPQFLDIVLNLMYTDVVHDSILHRAKEAGKRMVFYGDDTWLKLYPNIFERYEGVSSFFVNDFIEVDYNVTHNVRRELNNLDWDIMLLHYLGLDHIGHVFGPFSHLVQPKLLEMDEIIKKIYFESQFWNKKTLLLITGDHGMKDSGGHGGATDGETYVPLITIGMPCKNDSVRQTDVPSTLATLMGLTLPAGNIGYPILSMLTGFSIERRLYILNYVCSSLKAVNPDYETIFANATNFHYKFLHTTNADDSNIAELLYQDYLNKVSEKLLHSFVKQDDYILFISILIMLNYLCMFLQNLVKSNSIVVNRVKYMEQSVVVIIILTLQLAAPGLLITITVIVALICSVLRYLVLILNHKKWNGCDINVFLVFCTVLHMLSLQSSSFIEEEHQSWYFFFGTCVFILSYNFKNYIKSMHLLTLFLCLRLLRILNPAGDKWSHLPTLSQWLLLEDNYACLQMLLCFSLILIYICCISLKPKDKHYLSAVILILIYLFNVWTIKSVILGKLIWILIFVNFALGIFYSPDYINHVVIAWILYCALLLRPFNVILLPICIYCCFVIRQCVNNTVAKTVIYIWIGRMFFFLQGHSNSLASIDVAAGYVGLESYIPHIVFLQTLCHTYTFPVLTNLLLLRNELHNASIIWNTLIIYRLSTLVLTCIVVFIQKHHLFVWSVFAPKLLIESVHSVILLSELLVFCLIKFIFEHNKVK